MIMPFFDIMMSVYQAGLIVYVLKKQFVQKQHSILWEISCVLLTACLLTLIQVLQLSVPDSLMFLIPLVYVKITTHESFLTCAFGVIVDAFLFMGTLSLVSSLFDIQIEMNGKVLAASNETMLIYGLTGNVAITAVLSIAARINRVKNVIKQQELALFLLMLVFCFIISECFFAARVTKDYHLSLVVGSICAFILMILTIILYEHMIKSAKKQKQIEMAAQTMQLSTEHQGELEKIYKHMLSEQHDLRHRIAVAEEMLNAMSLKEEERNKVLYLLKNDSHPRVFLTGSMATDAILTVKAAIMESAGIKFTVTEYPLNNLPLSEQQFCVLLGNLLDNAIEGVMALPATAGSRNVYLTFSKVWDMLFITCCNDADLSNIRRRGDTFLSTKTNPELHGFGIDNMRNIVETAGGTIEFNLSNDQFTVEIMIGGHAKC